MKKEVVQPGGVGVDLKSASQESRIIGNETSEKGYDEDDLIGRVRRVQRHGFGEIRIVIKNGAMKELFVTESWRKTKH